MTAIKNNELAEAENIIAQMSDEDLISDYSRFSHDENPLILAVINGYEKIVDLLLARKPELINSVDDQGKSTAYYASKIGHKNIITKLLQTLNNELKTLIASLELKDDPDLTSYTKTIKFLELCPRDIEGIKLKAKGYDDIGDIYKKNGQNNLALANYAEALKLDRNLADTYKKIGKLLFNEKNYAEALKYFKVVRNTIKSAECFDELIKLNPEDAFLRIDKGDYYLSIGRNDKAKSCYQEAYILSNDIGSKQEALRKKNSLTKDGGQNLRAIALELERRAATEDFCNFDDFQFEDLDKYQLSVIGDNEGNRE